MQKPDSGLKKCLKSNAITIHQIKQNINNRLSRKKEKTEKKKWSVCTLPNYLIFTLPRTLN